MYRRSMGNTCAVWNLLFHGRTSCQGNAESCVTHRPRLALTFSRSYEPRMYSCGSWRWQIGSSATNGATEEYCSARLRVFCGDQSVCISGQSRRERIHSCVDLIIFFFCAAVNVVLRSWACWTPTLASLMFCDYWERSRRDRASIWSLWICAVLSESGKLLTTIRSRLKVRVRKCMTYN